MRVRRAAPRLTRVARVIDSTCASPMVRRYALKKPRDRGCLRTARAIGRNDFTGHFPKSNITIIGISTNENFAARVAFGEPCFEFHDAWRMRMSAVGVGVALVRVAAPRRQTRARSKNIFSAIHAPLGCAPSGARALMRAAMLLQHREFATCESALSQALRNPQSRATLGFGGIQGLYNALIDIDG